MHVPMKLSSLWAGMSTEISGSALAGLRGADAEEVCRVEFDARMVWCESQPREWMQLGDGLSARAASMTEKSKPHDDRLDFTVSTTAAIVS